MSAQITTMPTLATNLKFMNFYPFDDMESISPRPTLFITGSERTPASTARMPTSGLPELKEAVRSLGPAMWIFTIVESHSL